MLRALSRTLHKKDETRESDTILRCQPEGLYAYKNK